MCCPICLRYADCRSRTDIHAHKAAQQSMPNPHYHLCRLALAACDFNCKRCGRLSREMPILTPAHFAYGCCHRCAAYQGCDFMDQHRKVVEGVAVTADVPVVPTEFKDVEPAISEVMPEQNAATSPPA